MHTGPALWSTVLAVAASAALFDHDGQAVLGAFDAGQSSDQRPKNIVFILTDDQDAAMDSVAYMPLLQKYLAEQGTTFTNHFTTTAICCPSRVSLWTGKQPHNTNVTDVNPPHGKDSLTPALWPLVYVEPQLTASQEDIPSLWPRD